ncbi:hypothetical protein K2173_021028 [Erythroxylum novogranatense]|uniref:DUF4371 domain-containing protein n=1 Tax=Erythroxylum novogranatense TaxID=1862640 RepID=A0AAV8TMT4_9ROSI|nr:hypothetical protein K2173_021028 [Erythroxylum novogranatense]
MNQKLHIQVAYANQSNHAQKDYRTQLTASVDCVRFLLRQVLVFYGRDESEASSNNGNFLQLLQFLADHNEAINNVVLNNARGNLKVISPDIQKDIVKAAAIETSNAIINDLQGGLFSILIDESRDISIKEQLAIVLRYVNAKGCVLERFIGIIHVSDTTSLSLKFAIDELFSKHGLSISSLRGQGYDGASNMQGAINGLKTLILKENNSAHYVHCFSHQLQLTLVAVAKNHVHVALLFNTVSSLSNIVGGSCKRKDLLREKQFSKIVEGLKNGELSSGKGLHQETSLQRPGDTRWGTHYGSLSSLIVMFDSIVDVLEIIMEEGTTSEKKGEAYALLDSIQSYEFVFSLHLMKKILGITNELSQALQRKDQDIINAISFIKVSKQRLQMMRDDGWQLLFDETSSFLELFYTVIDMQLQELNNRFNEVNTKLLICVACLNPSDSFYAFDKQKLIQLA